MTAVAATVPEVCVQQQQQQPVFHFCVGEWCINTAVSVAVLGYYMQQQ